MLDYNNIILILSIEVEEGSILKFYLDKAADLTPEERGKLLENDTSFTDTHQLLAIDGQTEANNEQVQHHFVAFVNYKNELFELDGRKSFPISHGTTSDEKFVEVISLILIFNEQSQLNNIFYLTGCSKSVQNCNGS